MFNSPFTDEHCSLCVTEEEDGSLEVIVGLVWVVIGSIAKLEMIRSLKIAA